MSQPDVYDKHEPAQDSFLYGAHKRADDRPQKMNNNPLMCSRIPSHFRYLQPLKSPQCLTSDMYRCRTIFNILSRVWAVPYLTRFRLDTRRTGNRRHIFVSLGLRGESLIEFTDEHVIALNFMPTSPKLSAAHSG